MSFLDNLENNLKALESQEEAQDPRAHQQRESQRAQALAAAPWAEQLKKGPFTADLLRHAARIGHGKRVLVRPVWLGTTLRLDAGERRLELRPTPDGVLAVFCEGPTETGSETLDLTGNAEALVQRWLA